MMTALEAIEILKTDMGCYECTFGCSTPYECENDGCPFRKAIHLAVERLSIDILPKMIMTEPQTERPCDNCQEFDCYGCEYKQAERSE